MVVIAAHQDIQTISINFLRIDGYKALLVHYKPIINNDTGDVIAIQGKLHKLEHPFSWYNISNLIINERTNNGIYNKQQDDLLVNIELEILFLLFNCDSYKDISDILSIAHGKIYTQDYVGKVIRRSLMQKLKVFNVTALKKKAIELGYNKRVPLSLMGEMIVEIDKI